VRVRRLRASSARMWLGRLLVPSLSPFRMLEVPNGCLRRRGPGYHSAEPDPWAVFHAARGRSIDETAACRGP
jgi:hypothetical protein